MCDEVVLEQRHLALARRIRADRVLDPEGVDDLRFHARGNLRPVQSEQGLAKRLVVVPSDGPCCQPLEGFLQGIHIHRLDFGLDDEPRDGIEVDADHPATQPECLDHRRSAAHEGIEHDLARGIRIVTVIAVELLHEVGGRAVGRPGRLQRPQQNRPEHARRAPREPLVHLVDGLEAVALRLRQAVDLDNGEAHLDGARRSILIHCGRSQEAPQ